MHSAASEDDRGGVKAVFLDSVLGILWIKPYKAVKNATWRHQSLLKTKTNGPMENSLTAKYF